MLWGKRAFCSPSLRMTEFLERVLSTLPDVGIEGRGLHSYRYAWAQRARAAGMPEREAMNHLGHESRAIHAAYAGGATVATLPLEFYEAQKRGAVHGGSLEAAPQNNPALRSQTAP
jgi:integrase